MTRLTKTKLTKPSKSVRATLLSGFLGSGKTSLLRHVLANKEGLRCAVIVNEISELNLDADALTGTHLIQSGEKLVEMANGCICCTLREDLLKQLRELSSSGKFDCVLIESSGIAEPMQVAETFFVDLEDGNGQLQSVCALDNCVTIIDASTFMDYMGRIDTVGAIDATAKESEDDRDIAQLFMDQIEFANVIILNKIDLFDPSTRAERTNELMAIVRKLAPKAKILTSEHGRVPLDAILNTNNFTLEFANGNADWMDDIRSGVAHVPETLEYGVSSVMFKASLPFHPTRLYEWLTHNFVLNQVKVLDDDEPQQDPTEALAKRSALRAEEERKVQQEMLAEADARKKNRTTQYGNLFRSKGFVWVGNPERDPMFGVWSQAGNLLSLYGGSTWDELPQPEERASKSNLKPQQLLAFVGQNLNAERLLSDLRKLLMNDEEYAQLKRHLAKNGPIGTLFTDKFEPWADIVEGSDDDESGDDEGAPKHKGRKPGAKKKKAQQRAGSDRRGSAKKGPSPQKENAATGKRRSSSDARLKNGVAKGATRTPKGATRTPKGGSPKTDVVTKATSSSSRSAGKKR